MPVNLTIICIKMNVFKEVYKIAIFMKEARIYVHSAIMIISEIILESV